ncbi:unnamed protein product, partial [Eretmochelys imbricata]
ITSTFHSRWSHPPRKQGREVAVVEPAQQALRGETDVISGFVTFKDVTVYFNKGQRALLDSSQRALYRDVMQENYETEILLGFPITKP